ncbi:MAG TPA: hypothetical protein VFJ68_00765, partial [Casimicrobiaceae bacterium]|nr:hypothetical protein [Casimicrobiaceae bacterium]
MSIYHARRKQPGGTRRPAPTAPASDALDFAAAASEEAPANMARLRKASPVQYMPATIKWIESLPSEICPIALGKQHARIANLLAQQWNDDEACRAYFDDLLMGRRAKRRGFSANVRGELWVLREYFQRTRLTTVNARSSDRQFLRSAAVADATAARRHDDDGPPRSAGTYGSGARGFPCVDAPSGSWRARLEEIACALRLYARVG